MQWKTCPGPGAFLTVKWELYNPQQKLSRLEPSHVAPTRGTNESQASKEPSRLPPALMTSVTQFGTFYIITLCLCNEFSFSPINILLCIALWYGYVLKYYIIRNIYNILIIPVILAPSSSDYEMYQYSSPSLSQQGPWIAPVNSRLQIFDTLIEVTPVISDSCCR